VKTSLLYLKSCWHSHRHERNLLSLLSFRSNSVWKNR